jgi:3-oxoacyl-[acyl-carrier-protein] synthase II
MGVNTIVVCGWGAVSPAGWGVPALRAALDRGAPVPVKALTRPGWARTLAARPVPPPPVAPSFLAHPRLRRASRLSQYALGAAWQALGEEAVLPLDRRERLGIVMCVMAGCVSYSRRFYEETLRNPAIASPLIFPETVFNAPASHLAACLGSTAPNYTLVGDEGTFLQALALGADWLLHDSADACLVLGAEEVDWIVSDALRRFQRAAVHSEGAGALLLRKTAPSAPHVRLAAVTDPCTFVGEPARRLAAARMRGQLPGTRPNELLCLSTQRMPRADAAETAAWRDWTGPRLAPREILGQAFNAASAWQCVAACDAIQRGETRAANVSVVGTNQQAVGARFLACTGNGSATGSPPETDRASADEDHARPEQRNQTNARGQPHA